MIDRRSTANETAVREHDKFMLRLPDGMRERLKEAAAENNRSMNAEIVQRLEDSFTSIPLGPEFVEPFMAASKPKRDEVLKDLGEVLDRHFPNVVIEITPEDLWRATLDAFSNISEDLRPKMESQLLEMCRELAKNPNWLPPGKKQ